MMEHLAKEEAKVARNILYENFEFFLEIDKINILEIAVANRDINDYKKLIILTSQSVLYFMNTNEKDDEIIKLAKSLIKEVVAMIRTSKPRILDCARTIKSEPELSGAWTILC